MKYTKQLRKNNKKNKKKRRKLAQTSGSDIFLNKILQKNRRKKVKYTKRKFLPLIKKLFILALILGPIGYGIHYFINSPFFKIKEIYVYGAGKYVSENDVKNIASNLLINKNILLVDYKNITKDIKSNFLGAKEIIIEKDLPETVKIKIEERIPLAIVKHDDEYLVDEEGYVLGLSSEEANLPKLSYSEEIRIGEFISKNIIPASSEIIKYAQEEEVKISSMSFYPKYAEVYIDNGVNTYINNESNKALDLKVIKSLLEKARLAGQKLKKIDLRYDKVIVLYE